MHLFAQPPLGTDAVAVTDDQHAHHQLRVNRRASDGAVEIGQVGAQVAEVQALIDAAQQVLGRDVLVQIERVEQARLSSR
ncbi:hypothetical protein FQZ97_1134350 [compost metagenome]